MDTLLYYALSNAVLVAFLALVVALVARVCRRPQLTHALWLLVLLKLITPPLITVPVPAFWEPARDSASATGDIPGPGTLRPAPEGMLGAASPETDGVDEITASGATLSERPDEQPSSAPGPAIGSSAIVSGETLLVHQSNPSNGAAFISLPALSTMPWMHLLVVVWVGGSVLWCGVLVVRLHQLRRLLRCAELASPAVQEQTSQLAQYLGLRRAPTVWLVPIRMSPALWALDRRPRLLVPRALWDQLNQDQRETLLAHELAHLRRGDHWVRRLELVLSGLYWWHPVVWWAKRELEQAEEMCCDAWVLRALPQSSQSYAETLLRAVRFLSQPRPLVPIGASGMGQVPLLKRRLSMILGETKSRTLPRAAWWFVLGLGVALLPLLPIGAQTPPAQSEPRVTNEPVGAGSGALTARGATATEPVAGATPSALAPTTAAQGDNVSARAANQQWRTALAEDLKEQLDLLKVQLAGKEGELEEAKALLEGSARTLQRMEQGRKQNLVGEEQFEKAQTEVQVLQARLRVKESQLKEAMLRISQLEKRATRQPQPSQQAQSGAAMNPFGTAADPSIAGQNTKSTASMSRTSTPSTAPAKANPLGPLPGVTSNTTGTTTANQLPTGGMVGMTGGKSGDQRLKELETKLDQLLKELSDLRKEMRGQKSRSGLPGAEPPAAEGGGNTVPVRP